MARHISMHHFADLAIIAEGVEQIMGGLGGRPGKHTDDLYVHLGRNLRLPVRSEGEDKVIGYFQWDEDVENTVFVPAKS